MRDAAVKGLAVGFFDGVHLGHQAILRGATAALTFGNHPLTVLDPARAPRLIMTPGARLSAIRACGVETVTMLEFTPELAGLSPEEFLRRHVRGHAKVLCGENWRFGRGGAGDADFLRARGIDVEIVPYAVHRGERISSSRIRASLEQGEIEEANAMLGGRFRATGARFRGKGVGSRLGYPTINLRLEEMGLRLPRGVYEVAVAGRRAIANYGFAPTMGESAWREPVLEAHVLGEMEPRLEDASAPVVEFVRFVRPERRFASVEDLKRQIAEDCGRIGT